MHTLKSTENDKRKYNETKLDMFHKIKMLREMHKNTNKNNTWCLQF